MEVLEQPTQVVVVVELVVMAHLQVLEVMVVQESLLLEPRSSFIIQEQHTVTTLPAPAGGCKVATFTVSGS
jgi:hypothetical protein